MDEVEKIAQRIKDAIPGMKGGTLRFWGEWFGRPNDNWHHMVGAEAEDSILRLSFGEGEVLTIWEASGLDVTERTFRIGDAARVRWEWHYYGRPKTAENRYFMDFTKTANRITATTNVDWYVPEMKPSPSFPAVEIL